MSSGAQQLQNDYELIRKLLDQYPDIKLIQTEGDPPETYDFEYNIKGYKSNPDGTESPDDVHQVRITLPFGYPHFPPTAKPLTPIFHPDIDPDAIRIADFWAESNSLPELIIHIGHMICGTIYSPDEPFNQRAFDWYEERKSWMPFDVLEPRESDEDEADTIEFDITEENAPLSDPEEPSEIDLGMGELDSEEDELDEEFSFQLDEVDDLVDLQDDESPIDFKPEIPAKKAPAASHNLKDLNDLPVEDDGQSVSIEPEDLAGIHDESIADALDLGPESTSDGPAGSDLSGSAQSLDPSELEEAKDEDLIDFGFADDSPPPSEDDQVTENNSARDNVDLQLDDGSSGAGTGEGQSIRPLIEKKEIFTAKKVLADIVDQSSVPDLKEFELTIAAAIGEAEGLYKKADKLEQKGELEKAGLILDLVANIATDYPGLEFARNRIRESKVADDQEKSDAVKEEREQERQASRKFGVKIPFKSIAAALVVAIVLAAGFMVYSRDSKNIGIARTNFNRAEQLVEKKDFKQARKLFTTAQTALNNILILQKSSKQKLQQQITAIVNSQPFKEGLQGRVLYDGIYVTIEIAEAMEQFKLHQEEADLTLLQSGNIDQAIASYEKSIEYAEKAGFQDQVQNIRQTINNLKFYQTLAQARKAEEEKEWKQAAETYQKALELGSNLSRPEDQADITQRLAATTFRHELDESKRAFTSSEWQKTIEMLQRAQKILDENPTIASTQEKKELAKLLINSRLYQILSAAKKAFENKNWDLAVHEYRGAINLLTKNTAVLGKNEVEESRKTIEKTILMTQITKEQNLTTLAAADNDLESTLKHYQSIVTLIDKSRFNSDELLGQILANARTQTATVKKELLIKRRVDWLTDNYEKFFRENYPSAKSSELVNPKISFIKREGNIMIFNMSCVEKKQGRSFRLELNYQYNIKKDSWRLYSGRL